MCFIWMPEASGTQTSTSLDNSSKRSNSSVEKDYTEADQSQFMPFCHDPSNNISHDSQKRCTDTR